MSKIVYLHVSSFMWIGSLGAEHYFGSLYCNFEDELKETKLTHKLTEKQAKSLNDKLGFDGGFFLYNKGQESEQFWTEAAIESVALKTYKKHFPQAAVLIRGDFAACGPQEILDCPTEYRKRLEELYDEAVEIGFYENDFEEMSKITDKWDKVIKEIEASTRNE